MYQYLFRLNVILTTVTAIIITLALSGCAGPLILGVKEITTSGGTNMKFITGADFRIGANGVDTVDDRRGIAPDNRPRTIKATN